MLGLTALGSAIVWYRLLTGPESERLRIPPQEDESTAPPELYHPHLLVALAGGCWIAQTLWNLAAAGFVRSSESPSLQGVQMAALVAGVVWVGLLALIASTDPLRFRQLGLRSRDPRAEFTWGALGFLAAWLPVFVALIGTQPLRDPQTEHGFFRVLKEEPGVLTLGWITLAAVIMAPLYEELLYRVIVQGWLRTFCSSNTAILLSALLFSLVHGFPDALALFPLALTLGVLYESRRSYPAVVITHALFNLWNLAYALLAESQGGM